MIVKTSESAHWYTQKGEPRYDATLREARKEHLLPSVTTVLKIIDKPLLTRWKIEQGIIAALTLPRNPEESIDQFAVRVAKDAAESSVMAAKFGKGIHSLIEEYCKTKHVVPMGELIVFWPPIQEWLDSNIKQVYASESVLVNLDRGYAGKCDLMADIDGQITLIDFKTQNTKEGEKISRYPDWAWQLSAMNYAVEQVITRWISVVISSREVGRIEVVDWPCQDINNGYRIFLDALDIFRVSKKFKYKRLDIGRPREA